MKCNPNMETIKAKCHYACHSWYLCENLLQNISIYWNILVSILIIGRMSVHRLIFSSPFQEKGFYVKLKVAFSVIVKSSQTFVWSSTGQSQISRWYKYGTSLASPSYPGRLVTAQVSLSCRRVPHLIRSILWGDWVTSHNLNHNSFNELLTMNKSPEININVI